MKQHLIVSIGSNVDAERNMHLAQECLRKMLQGICFTSVITTEAVGKPAPCYLNCLGEADTDLAFGELNTRLKDMEARFGRLHDGSGLVPIDVDILQLGPQRYHLRDWDRIYVQSLLGELRG